MRLIAALILTGGLLVACATAPDEAIKAPAEAATLTTPQLGPQTLATGECGLFGWTKETPSRFIFFATETRGSYWADGTTKSLIPSGTFPDMNYSEFEISLGVSEAYSDAVRYPSARLRQTLDDGFEMVQPLVILETCQDGDRP